MTWSRVQLSHGTGFGWRFTGFIRGNKCLKVVSLL